MNYRDLQNISNLSQEILIEGANEEHNVLNRWPYTSPYLQESTELDEAKRPLPVGKMDAKAKELKSKFLKSKPGSSEAGKLISRASQITGTRDSKVVSDSYDLYDIILSHLLDEGYADTEQAAEAIMVNMSEDWRESICEEYKKLPVGKMIRQASNKTIDGLEYQNGSKETPKGQDSYTAANRPWDHIDKMQKIANNHNPTKVKRKEDDNRRIGGRKRDAGRPRSN